MAIKMDEGISLKAEMVRAGLTIREIAKQTGLSTKTVSNIVNGKSATLEKLEAVASCIPTIQFEARWAWVDTSVKPPVFSQPK